MSGLKRSLRSGVVGAMVMSMLVVGLVPAGVVTAASKPEQTTRPNAWVKPDQKDTKGLSRPEALQPNQTSQFSWDKAALTGRMLVQFKSTGGFQRNADKITTNVATTLGGAKLSKIEGSSAYVFSIAKEKVGTVDQINQLVTELENNPLVEFAEPDTEVRAHGQKTSWGYDEIQAAAALTTNSATGAGVVIAVIDTGVDYLHEDLANNIWINSGEIADNNIDDDSNGYIDDVYGWDFIGDIWTSPTQGNDPMDSYGHGTHVAGIIAAENNSIGALGVASAAKIMSVKVLDSGGRGFDSTIASGIRYAADNGADIINLSLGGVWPSRAMREAVKYATSHGVLVIAAAGNNYGNQLYASYPALYPEVISVSALGKEGSKTWWSNWGKVDAFAPGEDIYSLMLDDHYATWSGTSMASPMVAGVAALIKQKNPGYSVDQMRHLLALSSTDVMAPGRDWVTGQGLVSALRASSTPVAGMRLESVGSQILGDGEETIEVKAIIRDAAGAPVVNQAVTWDGTEADVSSASNVTDASGVATVNVSSTTDKSLAHVSAIAGAYGTETMDVMVFPTGSYVENIRLAKTESPISGPLSDFGGGGESYPSESARWQAGDGFALTVNARALPRLYYFDSSAELYKKVDIAYQGYNASNAAVSGLQGMKKNVALEGGEVESQLMGSLPDSLASGRYRLEVSVTDQSTSQVDTRSTYFTVGDSAAKRVLVVSVDQFDWAGYIDPYRLDLGIVSRSWGVLPILDALNASGIAYDVWHGSSFPEVSTLRDYPVVIWANQAGDDYSAEYYEMMTGEYLNAGGNLLITGAPFWLECSMFEYEPACRTSVDDAVAGYKINDSVDFVRTVSGTSSSPFAGLTWDIDAFNTAGNGMHDQFGINTLTPQSGATAALTALLPSGDTETVGTARDSGSFKAIALGFGLTGINDAGTATRQKFLENAYNYFKPASVTVTSVSPSTIYNNKGNKITVNGTGFTRTGKTTVKLGGVALGGIEVQSRSKLVATVPSGFSKLGFQTLTVENAFGQIGTKTGAINVIKPVAVVAGFKANKTTGTFPLAIQFTDQSMGTGITKWAWDFGDGKKSSAKNPSHTYTKAGRYTVKLTATGMLGSKSVTKKAYIIVKPVAVKITKVSPSSVTQGKNVVITIEGSGFTPFGKSLAILGGVELGKVKVLSPTKMQATIPKSFAKTGKLNLVVLNDFAQKATKTSAIQVNAKK